MRLNELRPPKGSTRTSIRIGRGHGSGKVKTGGKGTKGQNARAGGGVPPYFEGGQLPFQQRVPKLKGFNNPFRVEYQGINLDVLEGLEETEVTPATLSAHGLSHKGALIKVLARGEITRPVRVTAHRFSKAAEQAILAAGGSVDLLPLPYAVRPPAKGNQFTNR